MAGFKYQTLLQQNLWRNQNWDSLTLDMQHGVIDYQNAVGMLQAISSTNVVPMARVNWNEPGQIMKILDAGAYGIICPMVSNKKRRRNLLKHVFIRLMDIEVTVL